MIPKLTLKFFTKSFLFLVKLYRSSLMQKLSGVWKVLKINYQHSKMFQKMKKNQDSQKCERNLNLVVFRILCCFKQEFSSFVFLLIPLSNISILFRRGLLQMPIWLTYSFLKASISLKSSLYIIWTQQIPSIEKFGEFPNEGFKGLGWMNWAGNSFPNIRREFSLQQLQLVLCWLWTAHKSRRWRFLSHRSIINVKSMQTRDFRNDEYLFRRKVHANFFLFLLFYRNENDGGKFRQRKISCVFAKTISRY